MGASGYTVSQLADLVTTTQKDLGKLKWTDISRSLQEYVALNKLIDKKKVGFQGGSGIQWNVKTGTVNTTRFVGLYNKDSVSVGDVMTTANMPWRHMTANYAFDRREEAINSGDAYQIVDLVKVRRTDCMGDIAATLEPVFWGCPDSTDELTPHGIGYWIVRDSSEGFNGGANSAKGFSTVAGLSPTTYSGWKNWTAQYTSIAKDDLIRKWRKAAVYTKFMPPAEHPNYGQYTNEYEYYTNYDVIGTLEEVLEAQNDNLGNDIASKDGLLRFRRTPVNWVPYLDSDTGDPVYGINWNTFKPVFLRGEYLKESKPTPASDMHNVVVVHIDLTMNFVCRDRRSNFVLYK